MAGISLGGLLVIMGIVFWSLVLGIIIASSVSSRSEDSLVGAGTDPGPDVLPDPPLEPTRPGEPPVIDTPQLPDPAEPWNEPETPEPPTPRPPQIPDDQLRVRADRWLPARPLTGSRARRC